MLKDKSNLGVWLLNDLELAIGSLIWPELQNNNRNEFDSVMIAPVNTLIQGEKTLTGMLFVTSRGRSFPAAHATAVKAFADQMGAIVPLLYHEKTPVLIRPNVNSSETANTQRTEQ